LCNASDLYPGIGEIYEAAPASQQMPGESIQPLEPRGSTLPGEYESLPMPPPRPTLPESTSLQNPAANSAPTAPFDIQQPKAIDARGGAVGSEPPVDLPPIAGIPDGIAQ
jgi:hypothetical protein